MTSVSEVTVCNVHAKKYAFAPLKTSQDFHLDGTAESDETKVAMARCDVTAAFSGATLRAQSGSH